MGGWSDKTKLILISTLVEVLVEVELGNKPNYRVAKRKALQYQWCLGRFQFNMKV